MSKTIVTKFAARCAACKKKNRRDQDIPVGTRVVHVARGVVMHVACHECAMQSATDFAAGLPSYVEGEHRLARIAEHVALGVRVAELAAIGFDEPAVVDHTDGGSIAEDMGHSRTK